MKLLLLNIGICLFLSSSSAIADSSSLEFSLFTKIEDSGVEFNNELTSEEVFNPLDYLYFHNGGGVAVGDINNDGLADIYFSGNQVSNRLYLNLGNLKFKDITDTAGVAALGVWSEGVSMMDFNADGYLDIYVCVGVRQDSSLRKNKLFINNGDETFSDKAAEFGLDDSAYSNQAAYLDYDNDGDLDLYLLNYSVLDNQTESLDILKNSRDPNVGDKLYRNDSGSFLDVSETAGIIGNPIGYGLGVVVSDLNNDLFPDIYVSNDFQEKDYLYINQRDGTFKEQLTLLTGHTSNSSMGVDAADYDNDGFSDLIVLDMSAPDNYRTKTNMSGMNPEKFQWAVDNGFHYQYMINTLQRNSGRGRFSEVSQLADVARTDWSWASLFVDLDLDGFKDLYITNGLREEYRNSDFTNQYNDYRRRKFEGQKVDEKTERALLLKSMRGTKIANFAFRNRGDLTFENSSKNWGLDIPSFSNGAAFADLDNDGDLELVVNNVDEKAFIFKNHRVEQGDVNYLKIKLKGSSNNPFGFGARLELETSSGKQMLEHYLVRGYKSSIDSILNFGFPKKDSVVSLKIIWPDGRYEIKKDIAPNQKVNLDYEDARQAVKEISSWLKPSEITFKDITKEVELNWKHRENKFNDFKIQLLLPHSFSRLGPAAAVGDINKDGLDDIFIGGAKGFSGAIFIQSKEGKFIRLATPFLSQDKGSEDISAIFFDFDNDKDLDLYVVSGGYEFRKGDKQFQDRLYVNLGEKGFVRSTRSLPVMLESGGVVASADYDNDGDLDLFIGSRIVPGDYPSSPRSFLLQNNKGIFTDVTSSSAPDLMSPGMVTDAIWSDFSGDGKKDLIVVGEWMPVMMMENQEGSFVNVSNNYGLSNSEGWWQHVSEIERKGAKKQYLLGNIGENLKLKASKEEPLEIYQSDFDENGKKDIVIAINERGKKYPLRGRQCSSEQIPFLKEKFKDYEAFGTATIEDLFDEQSLNNSLSLKAHTFSSAFLNCSERRCSLDNLPKEAQAFPIKTSISESSGKYLLLAGNHLDTEVETPRIDSGDGLVLKKNDNTIYRSVQSGFIAKGRSRNILKLKLANKKNGFLLVTNSGSLKVYQSN